MRGTQWLVALLRTATSVVVTALRGRRRSVRRSRSAAQARHDAPRQSGSVPPPTETPPASPLIAHVVAEVTQDAPSQAKPPHHEAVATSDRPRAPVPFVATEETASLPTPELTTLVSAPVPDLTESPPTSEAEVTPTAEIPALLPATPTLVEEVLSERPTAPPKSQAVAVTRPAVKGVRRSQRPPTASRPAPRPATTPRPARKPVRRTFDLSRHPVIPDAELAQFLDCAESGSLGDIADLDARKLDALLMAALKHVYFIGALPISEGAFTEMCTLLRREFAPRGRARVAAVWPATFVTLMVFCARYSHENARNFWTPYAKLVWGLPEAGQYFQGRCREHFAQCRAFLTREFGFHFPADSSGEVVRPVYRHTLLPFYLRDDFAAWLKSNLKQLADLDPETMSIVLRSEPSLSYVAPTLRSFIQSDDTAETAATLINSMVEAAKLYLDGDPIDELTDLMSSPIERDLWRELVEVLVAEPIGDRRQREQRTRLEWIWAFQDDELQLRLTRVFVAPGSRPALAVWVSEEGSSRFEVSTPVYPWENEDGSWFVDEVILAGGPPHGRVRLLDDEGQPVYSVAVPQVVDERFSIFRIAQQGCFGVRVDPVHHTMNDGEWRISMAPDVELKDESGVTVLARQDVPVPDLLKQVCRHGRAGLYNLTLPVFVSSRGAPLLRIEARDTNIGQPTIEGDNPVVGLTQVPPVFGDLKVRLNIPRLPDQIAHLGLWIKSGDGQVIYRRLQDLDREGCLHQKGSGYVVDLDSCLPNSPGMYIVSIRRGVQAVTSTPLQFGVLPGIHVVGPDPDSVYCPNHWPRAYLKGVSLPEIGVPVETDLIPDDEGVTVEWHDLRTPLCRLRLRIDQQVILLAWEIKRVYTWIDGVDATEPLSPERLAAAHLHMRGQGHQRIALRMVGVEGERFVSLDARGSYDNELRRDQLSDMLLNSGQTRAVAEVALNAASWQLLELVQRPKVRRVECTYSPDSKRLIVDCEVDKPLVGEYVLGLLLSESSPSESLHLGECRSIAGTQAFDCELPTGTHFLQILCEGEPLEFDKASVVVPRAQVAAADATQPAPSGLPLTVQTPPTTRLKNSVGDYVRLSQQYEGRLSDALSPQQLAFLATRPIEAFAGLSNAELSALWPPLGIIAALHDQLPWQDWNGWLPAWAVTDSPLLFRMQKQARTLKVNPVVLLQKGRSGIGYTDLKLDNKGSLRARVAWVPDPRGYSRLEVAATLKATDTRVDKLDPLDLMPAYMCAQCGLIVASKRGYPHNDSSIVRRHTHVLGRDRFKDLVYDTELLAELVPARGQIEPVYRPAEAVDRGHVLQRLESPVPDDRRPARTTSKLRYRQGILDCLDRTRESVELAALLAWLLGTPRWAGGVIATIAGLEMTGPLASVPLVAATRRLLSALPTMDGRDELAGLDRTVLVIALMMRGRAYLRSGEFAALTQLCDLKGEEWSEMLYVAWRVCPILLEWALSWVELFHIHTLS